MLGIDVRSDRGDVAVDSDPMIGDRVVRRLPATEELPQLLHESIALHLDRWTGADALEVPGHAIGEHCLRQLVEVPRVGNRRVPCEQLDEFLTVGQTGHARSVTGSGRILFVRNSRDASVLANAIEAHHPDPFQAVSRTILRREAARIDALGLHDRSLLLVELMRMLALLGPRNGHSVIFPIDDHPAGRRAYPLRLSEFEDGIFVVGSVRHDLVGAELVGIGGSDVGDILPAVTPLVAHDNEWTIRARRPAFLVDGSVLRGLGVIDNVGRTNFRLRAPDGSTVHAEFDAIAVGEYLAQAANSGWSRQPQPAYLRRRKEWNWVERISEERAVHIGYNVTLGDIAGFAQEVAAFAAEPETRLVVLDLRLNGGGDNRTYGPVLETLKRLSTAKPIAVLISRETCSAAMQLVIDLEQQTSAVFVGEPTGGSPNHFGDATLFQLPNSGLHAHVATIAWRTAGPDDKRLTLAPDILVAHESGPFFSGEDPTLMTALADVS